ncbi:apolipoprotein N-acyltransferase [Mucilaginibacter myungsuensis]|uniref:Apolipoprotein N-acyltransferase n=1 Tax=Mucilaginibacter myungsuensis TaxID=649104 RepID=A0A929PVX1_9SPHI|nr:apolipoprotein N-acyltransferase [Mucilaginibacter myungsuensis]MBE9661564.1 apolipoprotein N-acyltransferase [Mucilaginibacter myungsuensis]MDN3597707.1 apolipoprotein N-acyltransferase [Mucilaginibacter myungsuensis]
MKKNIYLAILSGLLLWIAWPPTPYTSFLLFVGLVPMLVAMENIITIDGTKKGRRIFRLTFWGFVVWNFLSIYWVYNALKMIGEIVAIPVSLIPYFLGPALMAGACWFYYRLRLHIPRGWALAALVCLWIGYEYLHQSWELNFPWMTLGNGFATTHQWIQWYEYTGVYGGTIWVWAVNIFIFLIYIGLREQQKKTTRLALIAGAVLILGLPLGLSLNRYYSYEEEVNPSNVVVAQPNIDPYGKINTYPAWEQLAILTHVSDSLAQPNTEFFIWPETAIAESTDVARLRDSRYYKQTQQFLSRYKNGNVITGIEGYKIYQDRATKTASRSGDGSYYYDRYNSAVLIENSASVQWYHKSRLVPGAESLPFGEALSFLKPIFDHLGGATGSYAGQDSSAVFYTQSGIGADPVICFESIWGEYVSSSVRKGAQFIAIITNDGWWENTSGKDQHLDYAKLRAIENRRWVARSANTGISAFINQRGDIVQQTKWWVRTALRQNINLSSERTFYTMHGDYLPKTGSVLALVMIGLVLIRIKRPAIPKVSK